MSNDHTTFVWFCFCLSSIDYDDIFDSAANVVDMVDVAFVIDDVVVIVAVVGIVVIVVTVVVAAVVVDAAVAIVEFADLND